MGRRFRGRIGNRGVHRPIADNRQQIVERFRSARPLSRSGVSPSLFISSRSRSAPDSEWSRVVAGEEIQRLCLLAHVLAAGGKAHRGLRHRGGFSAGDTLARVRHKSQIAGRRQRDFDTCSSASRQQPGREDTRDIFGGLRATSSACRPDRDNCRVGDHLTGTRPIHIRWKVD